MKHILITGAGGQLGREMQALAADHPDFTYDFTDAATLDVTDRGAVDEWFATHPVDFVVNCAAYTAVDRAESDREACHRLNALAPGCLADAARRNGAQMVHVSTDYVFDGSKCTPYVEDDEPAPVTVYGRTKLEGERAVMELCPDAMVIRTAWLYSPHGQNFVKTMLRLGRERDRLGVVFDQVGTPTYARDLARAIYAAIEAGIRPGIYHYTDEGVCSWYDFAVAIHRLAGIDSCRVSPIRTAEYPTPARRPAYSVLDKQKIKDTYGMTIPHWEDSLASCLNLL